MSAQTTIRAVLGPTNTGKTHRAIERMLDHETGMIGLPLRLLAREVYDRVTRRVGEDAVALVTGEEKRVPPRARYWICTVEAMPIAREVDFLAVDEVQLAAHPERGHVFTSRLLGARGRRETWFMGADTIAPILRNLVPTAVVEGHPRLSRLSGIGQVALSALPPRTAIVAFSIARVYEIAERVRARRGGAAVVLGALSPRARNAQVALYQSGEVDYMVATDAIGMGLNMDVGCVAFADLRKFDGKETRELHDAEMAQIAGRAGRYQSDGTFATLAPLPPLPGSVARAIERHRFCSERKIQWRNDDLDVTSVDALVASLRRKPFARCLTLVQRAVDEDALVELAANPEIAQRARGVEATKLLWEVCSIPDFRQLLLDDHVGLLREIFLQLSGPRGRLDADWMDQRITRIDDVEGDLDTLLARMAFIRTWTYITHHTRWVAEAETWQARTRAIEDRLSDALHDHLVRRFVDRGRGRPRSQRAKAASATARPGAIAKDAKEVKRGFAELLRMHFPVAQAPAPTETALDDALARELAEAPHERFRIDDAGRIWAGEQPLATLAPGADLIYPEVALADLGTVGAGAKQQLLRRLSAYGRDIVERALSPLRLARDELSPAGRGLVYQLEKTLGTVCTEEAREQLLALTTSDRRTLAHAGLVCGQHVAYLPGLLRPPALSIRVGLASTFFGARQCMPVVRPSTVSLRVDRRINPRFYVSIGFPIFAARAIRADIAERVAERLANGRCALAAQRRQLAMWLGCSSREVEGVARVLGPPQPVPATACASPQPGRPQDGSRRRRGERRPASGAHSSKVDMTPCGTTPALEARDSTEPVDSFNDRGQRGHTPEDVAE